MECLEHTVSQVNTNVCPIIKDATIEVAQINIAGEYSDK